MCTVIYGTAMELNLTTGPVRVLDRYRRTFFRATAGARVLSSADVVNARFGIHCSDAAGSINSNAGTHSARGMSPATTNGRCQSGEVAKKGRRVGRQAQVIAEVSSPTDQREDVTFSQGKFPYS
ncbi:LOW QUALITY PROTEIN: hypothetical protein QC762_0103640 [Podospora pseudocomata]|uniref:Uncharacterized protein n=1 Tax=Podospora pseudocomata TaxID=2093779 RepID=A0ABR0G258_9PEZI|nr:LOW QUALITY PROTEIN: hypothetical protein QC762_0103640 [Podospora pseudocomata]